MVGLRGWQRVDGLDRGVPSFDWERRWAHRRHHHASFWSDQLVIGDGAPPAGGVDEGGGLPVVGGGWEEAHAARRDELGHHALVVCEDLRACGEVVRVQDLTPVLHLAKRLGGDAVSARGLVQRHKRVGDIPVPARSGMLVDDDEGGRLVGRAEHRVHKRHSGGARADAEVVALELVAIAHTEGRCPEGGAWAWRTEHERVTERAVLVPSLGEKKRILRVVRSVRVGRSSGHVLTQVISR